MSYSMHFYEIVQTCKIYWIVQNSLQSRINSMSQNELHRETDTKPENDSDYH